MLRELKQASDLWDYEKAEEKRKELEAIASQLRELLRNMEEEGEEGGEKEAKAVSNLKRTLEVFEKVRRHSPREQNDQLPREK